MISVVMPVCNGGAYIAEAARSLVQQTFADWELILVDDASTDGSAEIASALIPTDRLTVVRHETNVGVAAALNSGLQVVAGDFVARMDADDIAHPERLMWQHETLTENTELHVAFGWYQEMSAEGVALPTPKISSAISDVGINPVLLLGNPLSHPTACFNRRVCPALRYPEDQLSEDYALWLDMMAEWRVLVDPRPFVLKRMHGKQQSRVSLRHGHDLLSPVFQRAAARQGIDMDADVARLMLRPDQPATLDMIRTALRHKRELRRRAERSGEGDVRRIALRLQLLWTHQGLRNWDWPTRLAVLRELDRSELSMLSRVVAASARLKRNQTMKRALQA